MEDLSKEERLNQRIEKLEQQIYEKNNAFDKEQRKRLKRTFFIISGIIYLLVIFIGLNNEISDINTKNLFYALVAPPFVTGWIMFISHGIWFYIDNGAMKRVETIAKLEGELNAVKSEKYNNLENKKIKELERHIEYLENYQEKLIEENTYLRLNKVFENDEE